MTFSVTSWCIHSAWSGICACLCKIKMNASCNRQRLIKVAEAALYLSRCPVVLWYLIISFPDNDLAVSILPHCLALCLNVTFFQRWPPFVTSELSTTRATNGNWTPPSMALAPAHNSRYAGVAGGGESKGGRKVEGRARANALCIPNI